MPVVEKIESLGYYTNIMSADNNNKKHTMHITLLDEKEQYTLWNDSKIKSVWLAVIEFIKSNNQLNKNMNENYSKGAGMIAQERFEQINKHLWNHSEYKDGELLQAALFCINPSQFTYPISWRSDYKDKIFKKKRIDQLKVAGAFIAAEIDRQLQDKEDYGDYYENTIGLNGGL
jgi:hypothetical protein